MRHKLFIASRVLLITTLGIAWFAPGAEAEGPEPGLVYYTYASEGPSPNIPSEEAQYLSTGVVPLISQDWGGGEVLDSGRYEGVIVKYIGWINPPEPGTYYMCGESDDGFRLYLDGELMINDWYDRGGGCGQTADVDFTNGQPKQLVAYMYENGGGAHANLLYYTGSGGWAYVGAGWFTQTEPVPTTTTTIPEETTTTTIEETTTTIEETTTTVADEEPTTTTEAPVEETTTIPEETTTTQPEETWPPTTESTPPTTKPSTTAPRPTAPVTDPPVEETEPTSTEPPSTEAPTTSTPSIPETGTSVPSDVPTPSAPSVPEDSTESPSDTSANSGDTVSTDAVTSEPVDAPIVDSTAPIANDSTPPTLPEAPTASELVEYLTSVSPEDLQDLSEDEIASLIEDIASADLTDEEAEQLAVALSSAPPEVKKAFEEAVNIFGGQFDSYIPLDSKVPVKTRRVLIVVTAATFLLPSPSSRKVK